MSTLTVSVHPCTTCKEDTTCGDRLNQKTSKEEVDVEVWTWRCERGASWSVQKFRSNWTRSQASVRCDWMDGGGGCCFRLVVQATTDYYLLLPTFYVTTRRKISANDVWVGGRTDMQTFKERTPHHGIKKGKKVSIAKTMCRIGTSKGIRTMSLLCMGGTGRGRCPK